MKHYGDITRLSGYILPPVDVITGGSPCQDLSVAGNGAVGKRNRGIPNSRDKEALPGG